MIAILALAAACWVLGSVLLAPFVGACIAGRRMSHAEKEALGWGGLGLAVGLFFLATLIIGARP